uniref:Unconventional myosin-XV-like domain-containing protein n=1 Tax=Panagrolaimus davidi TaxID=227884 RepID=A0A914QT21_9BILA
MSGEHHSRRSPSKQPHSPHFLDNIDLQPRSPIYSYRNDTLNRSRASAEPTYFETRTLSRNGVNGTLQRKTPDSIASNGHHHQNETNGIYSRDMNKSYHEPSLSGGPTKSAMSLISAKSQSSTNVPATCFISEPWKLIIRREVFFPGETLDDIDSIDLVFSQIISDCRKNKPHRIRHFERDRINSILNKYRVPVESLDKPNEVSIEVKQDIINEARKWPLYFSRMYPVIEERNNERVFMILGISENGIRLMTRNVENVNDPMVPQAHFE